MTEERKKKGKKKEEKKNAAFLGTRQRALFSRVQPSSNYTTKCIPTV
jgi:hypothetical protein